MSTVFSCFPPHDFFRDRFGAYCPLIERGVLAKSKVERGHCFSRKKGEPALLLLRGVDPDGVSCELGVTAARLAEWRDQVLAGGQASLKSRVPDERDAELARLKALVGLSRCATKSCSRGCIGPTRFEALEPLHQGVRRQFSAVTSGIATGLQLRHDHRGQSMSDDCQADLRFLRITSSPAFVRAPEGPRRRGTMRPHTQGTAPLGAAVPHGRGAAPRAPGVAGHGQRTVAGGATSLPVAGPGTSGLPGGSAGGMKAPQVPTIRATGVAPNTSAHTAAPGTAIAEQPDSEVGANTALTVSKKSGAVHERAPGRAQRKGPTGGWVE